MKKHSSLCDLCVGEKCIVEGLRSGGSMRRRMLDIGLVEGTQVQCLQKGPSGEPVAYYIRGAVIALRREDSSNVIVRL